MPDGFAIIEHRPGQLPRVLVRVDGNEQATTLLNDLRLLHHDVALVRTRPDATPVVADLHART